ncbi:hypothetical protein BaRGS_00011657 [Batillaria attramentaria]|uniref:Ig-like domain-containing protein n=1 Tax=Batillaria attramentaria TaxID=370345 RepID=A0ABD0LDS4_9CAEN
MAGEGQSTVKLLLSLSLLAVLLGGIQADPGALSSCWVTASVETWMIHGSCFVEKIFSSVDNYTCLWNQRSDQGDLKIAGVFNLSEFEEGGKSYYRGNCSISHDLPSADGRYQYNVTVQPGSQTEAQDAGQVDIEYPKDPKVNCSEFAVENNTHFCQCTASTTKPEKPAPSVSWPNVSDTSDLKLPSVRRGDNGTVYTCQLTWGPDQNIVKTTNYTLQVAYGPDAVIIESENIMNRTTLTCHVDHINPPATFNWTDVCDSQDENQTHTVCVFEPTNDDDGKLVTCTATNVQTGLKASDTVRISLTEATGAAAKQSALNNGDDDDFVEMHVNDVYGLGDTTNDDPNQVKTSTKPMAAAWRVPPTSSITEPGKPTMARQVFSTSNGDTPYMNLQEHAGVTGVEDDDQYAVVGEEINTEHIEGPKGDVYAVVHKTNKKQETPEHGVHFQVATEPSSSPGEEGSGQGETNVISPPRDVYAEVDKSSKGANSDHNFEKQTDEKKNREQPNVDPKTSKPIAKPRTTMETEPSIAGNGTAPASHLASPGMRAAGESYENVTMSSSELPSLVKPDVTKATDVDDEYTTLMLTGRNPTESDEPNPDYSHIGAV